LRFWLVLILLVGVALPAAAETREVRLAARETVTAEYPGVITAFAVDADIVVVTTLGGQVVLTGRRVGETLVTVVMPATVETLTVRVEAAAASAMGFRTAANRSASIWEGRYDSGIRRFSTGLTMASSAGERTARLRLYGIYQNATGDGGNILALPTASLELEDSKRSVVLLDELVKSSPLTLDGTVLRGFHLHQGPLNLHAGIASATPWNDLLLPSSGDRALGMSYRIERGELRVTPALLWLPDSKTDVPGVVSLGLERGKDGDPLRLKTEFGWSDVPGASFDFAFHGLRRQGWLQGATRSADFAALNVARSAGSYLDGAWSEQFGERTTADLTLSASRLELVGHRPEVGTGRLELRNQTTDHWSLTAGVGGSGYRDRDVETAPQRRGTVSLGTAYDANGLGIATIYRYQETSGTSHGGHGGRLTLHGARGTWKANLFIDAQQQAPTLNLIFQERPDLARAFAERGFVASSPEEVVRLLRDNAAILAAQGVKVGTLDLAPLRLQGGLNLSWRGTGPQHPEFGLRAMADDTQSVASGRRTYLATLFTSVRIFGDTELYAGYTRWSTRHDGSASDDRSSFEVAVRTSFSAPGLPGGGRPITGQVFRDDSATGMLVAGSLPLAGVEVVLDGQRSTLTDQDGRFTFSAPGRDKHRVEALLPPKPGAYFTMPSAVTLSAGGEVRFAIAFSAARLSGTVRSDAGLPLAGVTLKLESAREATTTTDSNGAYRFAAPAGEARVFLVADSVPPGYELSDLDPQTRILAPGAPAVADFTVRAQRVLSGEVSGVNGEPVTVTALEANTTVSPDNKGRFLLRGLPAGPLTLVVRRQGRETRQVVEVPAEPGSVTGVKLTAP
jgi:hypothetical protein